jgi:hypothetical protein
MSTRSANYAAITGDDLTVIKYPQDVRTVVLCHDVTRTRVHLEVDVQPMEVDAGSYHPVA